MKAIILLLSAFLLTFSGHSQRVLDVGLWGGSSNYFGDLEGVTHFQAFHPTVGAFIRYNFNPRISLRLTGLFGEVGAKGTAFGEPWPFPEKNLQDLSLQCEINYLRYIFGDRKTKFSSYVSAGMGMMHYPDVVTATFPFGLGIKYNAGKRIALGMEYQMRKLFDDSLDDLDDPLGSVRNGQQQKYTDFWHNNDWVTYLGIHITYFMSLTRMPCPAYEKRD